MVALLRSAALNGYAELARSVGLDPVRLMRTAGIPATALTNADLKIRTAAFNRLLEISASRSGLEDFGLRLSRSRRLSNLGPIGLLLREQPTMRKALEATMQLGWLHNESVRLRLEETGDLAILHCLIDDDANGRQSVELTLTVLVVGMRALLGENWRPQLICFPHAPPRSRELHRRVFNCELAFNQDFAGIVFARRDLDMTIPGADPTMAREIARYIERLAGSRSAGLADKVKELVIATLASGQCTAERVSESLGFDRRTLHRKLGKEGTTFSEIVDRTRTRLVEAYLKDRRRSLTDVSALLGFSSLSAFSRWHRGKFGRSATRRKMRS